MVKIERTPTPPASLAIEKPKASGKYNLEDVVTQLHTDAHGKCYLCEQDELQSIEVEHLVPHHGDIDLKFDWNNLFYSCAHCNSVKNRSQYEKDILDCCVTDPETVIHTMIKDNASGYMDGDLIRPGITGYKISTYLVKFAKPTLDEDGKVISSNRTPAAAAR